MFRYCTTGAYICPTGKKTGADGPIHCSRLKKFPSDTTFMCRRTVQNCAKKRDEIPMDDLLNIIRARHFARALFDPQKKCPEMIPATISRSVQTVKTRLRTALHSRANRLSISPIPPSIRSRDTVATLSNFTTEALLSPVPENEG